MWPRATSSLLARTGRPQFSYRQSTGKTETRRLTPRRLNLEVTLRRGRAVSANNPDRCLSGREVISSFVMFGKVCPGTHPGLPGSRKPLSPKDPMRRFHASMARRARQHYGLAASDWPTCRGAAQPVLAGRAIPEADERDL